MGRTKITLMDGTVIGHATTARGIARVVRRWRDNLPMQELLDGWPHLQIIKDGEVLYQGDFYFMDETFEQGARRILVED
jgi:hypothetical protein